MRLFRKSKTCIIAQFVRTDLVICSHSREGETPSYNRINTVVAVRCGSGAASLEALFVMQHCIDAVLFSAVCLNVFKRSNCHCAGHSHRSAF